MLLWQLSGIISSVSDICLCCHCCRQNQSCVCSIFSLRLKGLWELLQTAETQTRWLQAQQSVEWAKHVIFLMTAFIPHPISTGNFSLSEHLQTKKCPLKPKVNLEKAGLKKEEKKKRIDQINQMGLWVFKILIIWSYYWPPHVLLPFFTDTTVSKCIFERTFFQHQKTKIEQMYHCLYLATFQK